MRFKNLLKLLRFRFDASFVYRGAGHDEDTQDGYQRERNDNLRQCARYGIVIA
jgi:hypothetical protein